MPNSMGSILRLSIISLSSLIGSAGFCQQATHQLIKSIPLKGTLLSSDKLGNAYVVTDRQEILKISSSGKVLFSNNIKSLGNISLVSTSNPLKILVYYPDFSTIITLDNTLSQTSRINLLELGSNRVSAACVALDNNIWIYDEIAFKLRKIDDKMNVLAESEDLNVLTGQVIQAAYLVEKDNFLYLSDPEIGILVFDTYGTYFKTIPLKGLHKFQKIQEQLVFFKDSRLAVYNLITFSSSEIAIPDSSAYDDAIEKDRIYLLTKDALNVYSH